MPSVLHSLLQINFIFRDMRVDLRKHTPISMSHQRGYGDGVVALYQFSCRPTVAAFVKTIPLSCFLGKAQHAIANSVLTPRSASLVKKELPLPALCQQTFNYVESRSLNVNNAFVSLALAFLRRKDNSFALKFNVARFYVANFLGPCAGKPSKLQNISEGIANWHCPHEALKIFLLHISFPPSAGGFLELMKWSFFKMALLNGPIINSLDGNHSAASIGWPPGGFAIDPLLYVERAECHSIKVFDTRMQEKVIEITIIPLARTRRTMFAAPTEYLVISAFTEIVSMRLILLIQKLLEIS